MPAGIAIVTNARPADQCSMLGYGKPLLEAARSVDPRSVEMSATSVLSNLMPASLAQGRAARLVRDIEGFLITPASLCGRSARICHVVDPGNANYFAELAARGRENATRFSRRTWFAAHAALYGSLA